MPAIVLRVFKLYSGIGWLVYSTIPERAYDESKGGAICREGACQLQV